jgi:hypothetical protein
LMTVNAFPFVPSLNKLVVGRSDEEWVKYYRNWMLKCDVVLATKSHRKHEIDYARENHVPIAYTTQEAIAVQLQPFAELGRKFGEHVAANLPKNEEWRTKSIDEVNKEFELVCGLGNSQRVVGISALALQVWDRATHG